MDRPRFELSADTRLLAQRLRAVPIGGKITYADLRAIISEPVDGTTPALRSARHVLKRDHMIVFDVITGVGLLRLTDMDIVASISSLTRRIRRGAERGVSTLACVQDFSGLPRDAQARHTAVTATLCAVAQMTTETALASITEKITPTTRELPLAETLAMFSRAT